MINVLTLNWNGLDKLKELQPGLEKNLQRTGQKSMWHIRDNGSTDGSKEWLAEQKRVNVLDVDHNRSNFAQGVNSLAADLSTDKDDYFLLLNNDVVFNDDESLARMLKMMKDPEVGIVGARLLYKGTDRLQHAGVIFGPRYGNMPFHFRHREPSDRYAQRDREFQAVTAACCLVRATVFGDQGGLDEEFSWAFEDIDFCLRAKQAGWKIVYCGQTEIFHEESASLKKNPVNKLFLSRNVARFKKKWVGKYDLDHEKYLKDPAFNEVR
jgi:GT2 family glycosyltransferase